MRQFSSFGKKTNTEIVRDFSSDSCCVHNSVFAMKDLVGIH